MPKFILPPGISYLFILGMNHLWLNTSHLWKRQWKLWQREVKIRKTNQVKQQHLLLLLPPFLLMRYSLVFLVSNICKAAPISFLLAPNGLNEFSYNMTSKLIMAFLTGQSSTWYTGGVVEQGFRCCFVGGLSHKLSSVCAAGYSSVVKISWPGSTFTPYHYLLLHWSQLCARHLLWPSGGNAQPAPGSQWVTSDMADVF